MKLIFLSSPAISLSLPQRYLLHGKELFARRRSESLFGPNRMRWHIHFRIEFPESCFHIEGKRAEIRVNRRYTGPLMLSHCYDPYHFY